MSEPSPIVVISQVELQAIIRTEVRSVLSEIQTQIPNAEAETFDYDGAQKFTGFSASTLSRAVKNGSLRVIKAGRATRFSRDELKKWMESQTTA